jgi:hypothetical protein
MASDGQAQHEQTLRLFKRRAEDIFGCELAHRADALKLGQQIHFNVVVNKKTGERHVEGLRMASPPKEQVAYALTLIRPLTLVRDRLAWSGVLDALKAFCPDEIKGNAVRINDLRTAWSSYPQPRMRIMQGPVDPDADGLRIDSWDNDIARKYLYGDLVHGDDNAELLDALGDLQVTFAASAMASDGFILVNNTYEVMHELRPDIAPESAYFTQLVATRQASPTESDSKSD